MPVTLLDEPSERSLPIHTVAGRTGLESENLPRLAVAWARAAGFVGELGRVVYWPDGEGKLGGALFGIGDGDVNPLQFGALAKALPEGDWHFAQSPAASVLATLAITLGGYAFTRYGRKPTPAVRLAVPEGATAAETRRYADAVVLARDLVNTPANDMGPQQLEEAARSVAAARKAKISVVTGDALLEQNLPLIHAVGRAAGTAPRLIDFNWGPKKAPKVTLVGKGVCFDTGGLDIKPSSGMLLMKKDMGGAANVLALAAMIMDAGLDVRLRVLIPAVENSISGNAFRPGDVLPSRKGISVEIGNTDAEGRLILADALTLADEDEPDLLIDMATLTGAARVALGPDLPPFFTDDEALAASLTAAADAVYDPIWRLPLWKPYDAKLVSRVADVNNVTTDGFAGAITAALFLRRFVERAGSWAHFDIFAWNPMDRPHGPLGGEAQAIRALERVVSERYGRRTKRAVSRYL